MDHIVIVGAGQAGCTLAETLRKEGHKGRITLIGAETEPPYQRPPLSKKYLLGEVPKERLYLRPESFYTERDITLRLGTPVDEVDPQARTVTVGKTTIGWDALVFATGAVPRSLPAAVCGGLDGVYGLRNLAVIDAMAPQFTAGARLLIVGGGYIGLEAAAVAAQRGLKVTLLEAAPRILGRVACVETADVIRALHQSHGVDIREGATLAALNGEGVVQGARLEDGTLFSADMVLVGIGVAPDCDVAGRAGVPREDGAIVVDARGRTDLPGVWAAGDCTVFPYRGCPTRLESVQNAVDQAALVARNILGAEEDYAPLPWFWSDQYDLSLQIAGLNRGYTDVVVREGATERSRSHWYYDGAELLACDALNDGRAYMVAKRLLAAGQSPDPVAVADGQRDLKALLAA